MSEYAEGRIVNVWTEDIGTTLTADHAAAATILNVYDASVFNDDGDGGSLLIGDQVVAYTTVDDDAGTVTLAEGLTAAADEDDSVYVWSTLYDDVDSRQRAEVEPDGKGDKADNIEADVRDELELTEGDRGGAGEACTLRRRRGSDVWTVTGVAGRPGKARGVKWEDGDQITLTDGDITAGTVTLPLTHRPLDESLLAWHHFGGASYAGVDQTDYTLDADDQTCVFPLGAGAVAGDVIRVRYPYRRGLAPVPQQPHLWDDFNRATLSPGAYDDATGERVPWVLGPYGSGGGFTITSDVLYPVTGSSGQYLVVDCGSGDGELSVDKVGSGVTNLADDRIAFRVADDFRSGFIWHLGGGMGWWDLDGGDNENGTYTSLGDTPADTPLKIVMDGSSLEFYANGVLVNSITDSRNMTATRHGFGTSDATTGSRGWDNFDFLGPEV